MEKNERQGKSRIPCETEKKRKNEREQVSKRSVYVLEREKCKERVPNKNTSFDMEFFSHIMH